MGTYFFAGKLWADGMGYYSRRHNQEGMCSVGKKLIRAMTPQQRG